MRKIIPAFITLALLCLVQTVLAQEKFIDVRQEMADNLKLLKDAVAVTSGENWTVAQTDIKKAKRILKYQVKPLIDMGGKKELEAIVKSDLIWKTLAETEGNIDRTMEILRTTGIGKFKQYSDKVADLEKGMDLIELVAFIQEVVKNTAVVSLARARDIWATDVKPLIIDGREKEIGNATKQTEDAIKKALIKAHGDVKVASDILKKKGIKNVKDTPGAFEEYFNRTEEVEAGLADLARLVEEGDATQITGRVNAINWAISHHPKGFAVGPFTYSVWDWVFGLGIGGGFCIFAIVFGLYLRRSYYRRYKKGLD